MVGSGPARYDLRCADDKMDGYPSYRYLDNHMVKVWAK